MNHVQISELMAGLPDDIIDSAMQADYRKHCNIRYLIASAAAVIVILTAAFVYPKLRMQKPTTIPEPVASSDSNTLSEYTDDSTVLTDSGTGTSPDSAIGTSKTEATETTGSSVTTTVSERTDVSEHTVATERSSTSDTRQTALTSTTVPTQHTASTTSTSTTASTNQAETSDFQDQTTVEPHLYTGEDVTGTGISILRAEEIPVTVLQWNAAPPAAGAGDQIFCELYRNRMLPAAVLNENQALLASDLYRSCNFVLITLETYAADAVYSDGYLTEGILHFEVGVSPDTNTLGRQTIRFAVMVPKTLFLPFSQYTAEAIAVSAANAAAFAAMKEAADDPNHPKFTHYYYE